MLPGETPGETVTPDSPSVFVLEPYQVDTLNVFNDDSISDDIGNLTSTRLTGLGMGPDQFVAGRVLNGGITYGDLEALNIHLGHGQDAFTIETTHFGTTRVTGGDPFAANWPVDDTLLRPHDRRPHDDRGHGRQRRASASARRAGLTGAGHDRPDRRAADDRRRRRRRLRQGRRLRRPHARPRLADADDADRARHDRPRRHRPALLGDGPARRDAVHDHAPGHRRAHLLGGRERAGRRGRAPGAGLPGRHVVRHQRRQRTARAASSSRGSAATT